MPAALVADQPEPHDRSFLERSATDSSHRLVRSKSRAKLQSPLFGVFARQRNQSDASSRKMLISAPTDFRHLNSGAQHAFPSTALNRHPAAPEPAHTAHPAHPGHQTQSQEFLQIPRSPAAVPDWEPEPRRESLPPLEPLELSIYRTQNRLSPLLLQFELPIMVPSPPPAYAREEAGRNPVLRTQRSMPSLSRSSGRQAPDSLPLSPNISESNSSIKSLAYSISSSKEAGRSGSPDVEAIRKRVTDAMLEVEKLQKKIDNVVERQSLYTPSRPSSAQSSHSSHSSRSMPRKLPDLEPMPSIPALPPSAPSFAERLHGEDIVPRGYGTVPRRSQTVNGQRGRIHKKPPPPPPLAAFNNTPDGGQPPLPLVLRPPLRKKKPFSDGMSSLVFPVPPRKTSMDSVTNTPRPIKGADGFYQCVPIYGAHTSYESLQSLSTTHGGEDSEPRSMRSHYSPATSREVHAERYATFGRNTKEPPMNVGIAL
ncbi:hypothetical protein NLG97_g9960 [Lecanicillium saksenae]|uniref:Uncharacterized protein n=1 Tax=Lecanicillium saksenae TaxID=468837 RepID=A0ACC1QF26_9HYPO|nr:hypothetical protein NLG97_g9960 [Lecanicillium saksenae]